jgi:lysophospholipase L1-like esterase
MILGATFMSSANENPTTVPAPSIAMIGDSITRQGDWTRLLDREDVINWGHPGYTTGQLAWTFKDLIRQHPNIKIVFLSGGTNDLLLGVPVARIFENQVAAIRYWRERGVTPVLQSLLPQVDAPETNALIKSLNAQLRAHCTAENVRFLDLTPLFAVGDALRPELSADGTHLKPPAYAPWAEQVSQELKALGH